MNTMAQPSAWPTVSKLRDSRWQRQSLKRVDTRFQNRFNSLGIPVDNLSLDEAVDQVFTLIDEYHQDHEPKLVATLNVDFLVNSLGYTFAKPRHPELFRVLRQADLITADGFPIVMLSKIAGYPLKERVTGADLTPELTRVAAQRGKSVYLLGGDGNSAQLAADMLQQTNPGLEVAGVSAPMVHIAGEKLAAWEQDDSTIVEAINSSGADILFMAFGNPKQELWFSRNKHRLTVPVSIGIGGTFAFITGQVKRAPQWMQRCNMEWIYRITQDPKRLVKRYAIGLVKFGFLTMPLLWQRIKRKCSRWLSWRDEKVVEQCIDWQVHWAAKDDVLKTLRLPKTVTRQYLLQLVTQLQESEVKQRAGTTYLIDFSKVKHLSMAGNEAFCQLAKLFAHGQLNGLLIGMPEKMKKYLQRSRVMDLAAGNTVSVAQMEQTIMASNTLSETGELKSYMVNGTCFNYLSGNISGELLVKIGFEFSVLDVAKACPCIIDLRRVSSIDSAAIASLYRLANAQQTEHIGFSGITAHVQQMLAIVNMKDGFDWIDDAQFYNRLFAQA